MELRILEQRENPLLERKEVWFEVTHKGKPTPPKLEVAKALAAKLGCSLDVMVIRHYTTEFGSNKSRGLCLVYKSPEALTAVEGKWITAKKRIGLKEVAENAQAQAQ